MMRKKKRTAVRVIFLYLLLTAALWAFLYSCSNSYNHISYEKISPAGVVMNGENVKFSVLEHEIRFSLDDISPQNRLYFPLYVFSPDELRISVLIQAFLRKPAV